MRTLRALAKPPRPVLLILTVLVASLTFTAIFASRPAYAEAISAWSSTTSHPFAFARQSCVISGGYVYCVAGWSNNGISPETNTVEYAPVSSSGVGAWSITTSYRWEVEALSCVVSGGYVYCVGGVGCYSGVCTWVSDVYYAPISSSGVGAWSVTSSYPIPIAFQSCAVSGGYIYCVGGLTTNNSPVGNVYYATISSTGVGGWTATTGYLTTVYQHSCAASGGYIYCVGGVPGSSYSGGDVVDYAPVSSSGVGTWSSTTIYPIEVWGHSCAASGGYVYCVGGVETSVGPVSNVYYVPVSSSGVGGWSSATSYPTTVDQQSCAASGGYIYCAGGISYSALSSAVYYTTITTTTSTSVGCSPSTGTVGVTETCTAIVTNDDSAVDTQPTGTVTFSGTLPPGMPTSCSLSAGTGTSGSCTATWVPASGTEGSYSISASYGGDSIHGGSSTSSPTTLDIAKVTPSISTSLSSTTITVGGSTFDSATLSGATSNAGGTVTYQYFSGGSCAGTATQVGSPVTVTNGVIPNSASHQFNTAGSYSWNAVYSGDANNNYAQSGCELLTVSAPALISQPIRLTVASPGKSTAVTLTGCSVSPTSILANGVVHAVKALPACTITVHLPVGRITRYASSPNGAVISLLIHTCSSGTCSTYSHTVYQEFRIVFAVKPLGHGTTIPSGTKWYDAGASVSIKATPTAGHRFSKWFSSTTLIKVASPIKATTTAKINGPGTITATFT